MAAAGSGRRSLGGFSSSMSTFPVVVVAAPAGGSIAASRAMRILDVRSCFGIGQLLGRLKGGEEMREGNKEQRGSRGVRNGTR